MRRFALLLLLPLLLPGCRSLQFAKPREQARLDVEFGLPAWAQYFRERPLADSVEDVFTEKTQRSLQAQRDIEESDTLSFEQYLANFFAQYQTL